MNRNSCSNTRYLAAAATRQRSAARHASPRESLFCETVDIFNPVGPRIKVRHYHTVPLLWLALLCTGLALGARAQERQPFTNFVWVTQPVLELSPQSTWGNGVVTTLTGSMTPALEILMNTATVKKLIEENRLDKLAAAIETGTEDGMINFNQALYNLVKQGTVRQNEALSKATNPQALEMNFKGIFLDEGRRILG